MEPKKLSNIEIYRQEVAAGLREPPKTGRKKGVVSNANKEDKIKRLAHVKDRDSFREQFEKDLSILYPAQVAKAKKGDTIAFRELRDTAWGKPGQAQQVDVSVKLSLVALAREADKLPKHIDIIDITDRQRLPAHAPEDSDAHEPDNPDAHAVHDS